MGKVNHNRSKRSIAVAIESENGVYRLMYINKKTGKAEIIRLNSADREEFPRIW